MVILIDRSILSKAYFSREHVARHQLDSFNYFLKHNLQKVVNEQKVIETDIENRGKNNEPVWVELGSITVKRPLVREADGSQGRTLSLRSPITESYVCGAYPVRTYPCAWRRAPGADHHNHRAVTHHGGIACL